MEKKGHKMAKFVPYLLGILLVSSLCLNYYINKQVVSTNLDITNVNVQVEAFKTEVKSVNENVEGTQKQLSEIQ